MRSLNATETGISSGNYEPVTVGSKASLFLFFFFLLDLLLILRLQCLSYTVPSSFFFLSQTDLDHLQNLKFRKGEPLKHSSEVVPWV